MHSETRKWRDNNMQARNCFQRQSDSFALLFKFLWTAPPVKNSDILAGIHFIFLKHILYQYQKSFDAEFGPQWKDREVVIM